jgi:hypothetical protein
MKGQWDEDKLAEQWTLAPDELALLANKAGPTRLGCAVLLKAFGRDGRFPRSRQQVAGAVVVHLAKQVGVPAEQYLQYDWRGRAIKYHRAQIRAKVRPRSCWPKHVGRSNPCFRRTRPSSPEPGLSFTHVLRHATRIAS